MEGLEEWKGCEKYTVLEAVQLFIGINPTLGLSNIQCSKHPEYKYRYIPIRKIFIEAIKSSQLPAELKTLGVGLAALHHFDLEGVKFVMEESFVYREDIKAWLHRDGIPSEFFEEYDTPGYLDQKREHHVPRIPPVRVSEEDYRKLKDEIVDLKEQIEETNKANKTLQEQNENIGRQLDSLIEEVADAGPDKLKTLERKSYLNMIAVLLKIVSDDFPEAERHLPYNKDSKLINDIVYKYFECDGVKYHGLSPRNLSKRFKEARESFESESSRLRSR